jgi:hypothetical protein
MLFLKEHISMYKLNNIMKKLLFILLLLLVSVTSFSKDGNFLTGTLSDYQTRNALHSAEITIINVSSNESYFTYTDYEGIYVFSNIESGTYKLIVNLEPYICDTVIVESGPGDLNLLLNSH